MILQMVKEMVDLDLPISLKLAIKKLEKMANALTFAIFCGIIKKVKKIKKKKFYD